MELNLALCAALGITNAGKCSEVTLKIVAGQLPKVQATFWVEDAGALVQVTQCCDIVPRRLEDSGVGAPIPQAQAEAAEASHAG